MNNNRPIIRQIVEVKAVKECDALNCGLHYIINDLERELKEARAALEAAKRQCDYLEGKRQESDMQRNYYRDLVEKRWVDIEVYSRAVADHIIATIANPPGGVVTVGLLDALYQRFAEGKAIMTRRAPR